MDILFQLILIFFFIFLNGFFVMSEYALVSVRKTRIEELVGKGSRSAQLVLSALNHLPTYISATQFGITIASLALGWIGEPALANIFSILFEPHIPAYILIFSSHFLAITCSFILITFLQVIFGELAPKTIALQKPERLALLIITPLVMFTSIFKPFIWFLSISAGVLLRAFGLSSEIKKSAYTEDEIKLILNQSAQSGAIDKHEVEIIERVFRIGDLPISNIMVAKKDVIAFSEDASIQSIAKAITEDNLHTRFPIYKNSLEDTIGYVAVTDIYILAQELKKEITLKDTKLIRNTLFLLDTTRIDDVLVLFKKHNIHLGMIMDSQKKVVGIVSMEDIIESLVGEWREK